jgi:hypothetical protein
MRSDLARMAQSSTHTVSTMNRAGYAEALADFEDREKNGGQTSATISAEWRERLEEKAEADLLRPYTEGEIAGGLAGWKSKVDAKRDELDGLRTVEGRLHKHREAPEHTRRSLTEATTALARRMLAGMGVGVAEPETEAQTVDAAQLEARYEVEKRAAATATEALSIVHEKIAVTEKQLDALLAREKEFMDPALRELGEALGAAYIRTINDFRQIYSLAGALGAELGTHGAYGSGFDKFEPLDLPKPDLAACRIARPEKLKIRIDENHRAFWKNARNTLRADPKAKISLPKAA